MNKSGVLHIIAILAVIAGALLILGIISYDGKELSLSPKTNKIYYESDTVITDIITNNRVAPINVLSDKIITKKKFLSSYDQVVPKEIERARIIYGKFSEQSKKYHFFSMADAKTLSFTLTNGVANDAVASYINPSKEVISQQLSKEKDVILEIKSRDGSVRVFYINT